MSDCEHVWRLLHGNGYVLPEDEVHVWRATLAMPESRITKLWQILSSDERERADRFRFEVDRKRCIIGRGLSRLLLGRILDLPAVQLRFEYDEYGKPSLMTGQGWHLQFNVSHSGELVLAAVTVGRAVGIDVERIRTDFDADGIAARFFSANERRALASVPAGKQYEAFFACWTRKEAYLKASGVGLSLPLDRFDVSVLPGEEARLLETRPNSAEADRWKLHALDPGCRYAAALAVEGWKWKLKCWDWPTADTNEVADNL